jgi:hypothetical protein
VSGGFRHRCDPGPGKRIQGVRSRSVFAGQEANSNQPGRFNQVTFELGAFRPPCKIDFKQEGGVLVKQGMGTRQ